MSTTWKDVVQTVAPSLAALFGGPLAGVAVKALSEKLLGKPDGTEDEVGQAVASMSSADLLKLKEVEADLMKALEAAGVQREQIAAADRDSARKREVDSKDWTPRFLAALIVVGYGLAMERLMNGPPLSGDQQILWSMFGSLTLAVSQVLNYYFGSTSQSAAKNATIAQAIKAKGTP